MQLSFAGLILKFLIELVIMSSLEDCWVYCFARRLVDSSLVFMSAQYLLHGRFSNNFTHRFTILRRRVAQNPWPYLQVLGRTCQMSEMGANILCPLHIFQTNRRVLK